MAALDVVHACVAGRLRVHIAALTDNPDFADKLVGELRQTPAIHYSRASSVTGNVLIDHDPDVSQNTMLETIDRAVKLAAAPTRPVTVAWWTLNEEQTLQRLHTSRNGLDSTTVATRQQETGRNVQPSSEPTHPFALLAAQFSSLPIVLLGASTIVSLVTGGLLDAALVGGVIAANVAIGFVTERNAERIIQSFIKDEQQQAVVVRDGQPREVRSDDLVLGDLLVLTPGTILSADARIIESNGLTIDESILTGESLPSSKHSGTLDDRQAILPDRDNMAYCGTIVTSGSGIAAVVACGFASEVGRINLAVASTRRATTPMQRKIDHLGGQLTMASVACSVVLFGLGWLQGVPLASMIRRASALAVAAIPEGLPTVTTSLLATGMRDMQRRGVLIRSLNAVETLGSVDVICFDKTGTITRNQMQVTTVHINGAPIDVRNDFERDGQSFDPHTHAGLMELFRVAVLCNESVIEGSDAYIVNGSSTENALLLMAMRAGLDISLLRQAYPLLHVEYRTDTRRYMRTIHEVDGERRITAIKGNPIDVLHLCQSRRDEHGEQPLDASYSRQIIGDNEAMSSAGLRVLGFAYAQDDHPPVWLGMVGMSDPARPQMGDVITRFHDAGIRTVMLTGDQVGTAVAVAGQVALAPTIRAFDCATHPPDDIGLVADTTDVFARVSPLHKLDVVTALQDSGHVVAMTGDGVNDGPALRAANIGVTFGATGTDAARTVSDMVLAEDDLATMIVAVERGRTIYDNLRKAISFMVGTNSSEVMLTLAATAVGAGQPLNTAQLLWINLVTDVAIAYSLGFEPPEADVLTRAPRPVTTPILDRDDYRHLLTKAGFMSATAFATHLYGLARYGANGGGIAMSTLVAAQLLDGFSSRSRQTRVWNLPSNPALTASIFGTLGLQALVSVIPITRQMLGIAPMTALDVAVIAAGSVGQFLVGELVTKGSPVANV